MTANPDSGIDVLFGTGGLPKRIAAAALKCVGGELRRLRFDTTRSAHGVRMGVKPRTHLLDR